MSLLKRQPVPPIDPPAPPGGVLGHVIVTDTRGDRISTTDASVCDQETREQELAMWHARGQSRYAIAEVRLPGEVTRP